MKKSSKAIISILLIFVILCQSLETIAMSFDLKVIFDGTNIRMESETTDMSWNLDNFLPGQSDTSTVNITNDGDRTVTMQTKISVEEDNGLLEMIDLTVKNKAGNTVFEGSYTELETIERDLTAGETETYTVTTSLNVNAGNEYQGKKYKLKFEFNAIGTIPMGTLIVKYVDENGDDLEPVTVTTKKITETYSLPETGKEFEGYNFKEVEGSLSGNYNENGTTVTYKYEKKVYGTVNAKYIVDNEEVDGEPKVLKSVGYTEEVGTEYKYEAETFEGYTFTGTIDGDAEGTYQEGTKEVVFHYNRIIKYGDLIVLYVADNEEIEGKPNVLKSIPTRREVGETYKYEPEEFEGYEYTGNVDGNPEGRYVEGTTEIVFHYNKLKYGTLISQCIDKDNGEVLEQKEEGYEKVGTQYTLSEQGKEISGYTFVNVEGNTGTYNEGENYVRYFYEKIPEPEPKTGIIVIQCINKDNDEILKQYTLGPEVVGTEYTLSEQGESIEGYTFVEAQGDLTGTYTEEDILVKYYYEANPIPEPKTGRLIIRYVDTEGTEIAESKVNTQIVGTQYTLSNQGEAIEGYDFLRVEGRLQGEYTEEDIVVKYIYEQIAEPVPEVGKLILRYVDENGNEIDTAQVTTKEVGTEYEVDEIGKEIIGYNFITREGDFKGIYKEEDTIITYKYKKIVEPPTPTEDGRVIIIYVDENGNKIDERIETGLVSTTYAFTEKEVIKTIPGYTFIKIDGSLTGEYKKEDTIIYCRYEAIKTGRVIAQCIDENNKIIKQDIYKGQVGTNYDIGKVGEEIEGYEFLGVEGETSGKYTVEDIIVTYKYKTKKAEGPSTDVIELPKTGQFQYAYAVIGAVIVVLAILLVVSKKKDKKKNKEEKQ